MAVFHPTTQHLDALKAIPSRQVKRPAIPVPTCLQEAHDLPAWHASVSPKTNPAKELRDRAYAYLKKRVDELRTCGKYVFRQMPSRQRGYVSPFMRRKFQAEQRARSEQKE